MGIFQHEQTNFPRGLFFRLMKWTPWCGFSGPVMLIIGPGKKGGQRDPEDYHGQSRSKSVFKNKCCHGREYITIGGFGRLKGITRNHVTAIRVSISKLNFFNS